MTMQQIEKYVERQTTTDLVYQSLHGDILSLSILPGAKLSEVEVARQFGISRQPVRDAFNRLCHEGLLIIRPQKATQVRGFSMELIEHARFLRLAVEIEVVNRACKVWDANCDLPLQENIEQQIVAVDAGETDRFHTLDAAFHSLIYDLSGSSFAIQTMTECRQKTDRLCMLSLETVRDAGALVDDHKALAKALMQRSASNASKILRKHLSRLDETISAIRQAHTEYFE